MWNRPESGRQVKSLPCRHSRGRLPAGTRPLIEALQVLVPTDSDTPRNRSRPQRLPASSHGGFAARSRRTHATRSSAIAEALVRYRTIHPPGQNLTRVLVNAETGCLTLGRVGSLIDGTASDGQLLGPLERPRIPVRIARVMKSGCFQTRFLEGECGCRFDCLWLRSQAGRSSSSRAQDFENHSDSQHLSLLRCGM